jgi:hypothetical protein
MCRTPIEQVVHIQPPADRAAATRAAPRLDGVFRGALIVRVHESDSQQQLLGLSEQNPASAAAADAGSAGGTVAVAPPDGEQLARRAPAAPAAESRL